MATTYKHIARYFDWNPGTPTSFTPGTSPTYAAIEPSERLYQGGYGIENSSSVWFRSWATGLYRNAGGTSTLTLRLYDVTNSAVIVTMTAGTFGTTAESYFQLIGATIGPLANLPSGDARFRWEATASDPSKFAVLKIISVAFHPSKAF